MSEEPTTEQHSGHTFLVTPSKERGIHSGRPRYEVFCKTCFIVVHEATTGPDELIKYHLMDVARGSTP